MSMKKSHYQLAALVITITLLTFCGGDQSNDTSSQTSEVKEITTKTGITMVHIPAGEFVMGYSDGEVDERPEHKVKINAFYMDKYEVTQESYQNLTGRNTSKSKGSNKPVEQLSWLAAAKYCNMRSLREGLEPCYQLEPVQCNFEANGYRLPTEAEWEYACRAGTSTAYFYGIDPAKLSRYAWFGDNSNNTTHPVGMKAPNPWGLFDMYGNVWEWCNDYYSENYYQQSPNENPTGPNEGEECVLRGGGFNSTDDYCRSSTRYSEPPGLADTCFGYEAYGFRCVRTAEIKKQDTIDG